MISRVLTAALLWFPVWAQAADPVALLPDNTLFGVGVSRPEKLAALSDHPVVKAVKPGRLKDVFDKMLGSLAEGGHARLWKEECDLSPGEVLARFSGSLAAGVFDVKERKETREGEQEFEAGAAAVFNGDEKLVSSIFRALARIESEESNDKAGPDDPADDPFSEEEEEEEDEEKEDKDSVSFVDILKAKERTVESGGVTLHILEPEGKSSRGIESLAWCLRENMLLIASGEKPLQAMLDRAESGREEGTFAATPAWRTAKESTGDAEVLLALNGPVLLDLIKDSSARSEADLVLKPLGFDKLEVLVVGMRSDGAGITIPVHIGLKSAPWYLDLFKPAAGAQPPRFIPADVHGASWVPLEFGTVGRTLMDKIPEIFPPAQKILSQIIGGYRGLAGVDIEKEFIQQLGTGYFQITRAYDKITIDDLDTAPEVNKAVNIVCPDKEGAVIGLRLKDPRIVDTALRTVFDKMFRKSITVDGREYMGWKIHSSKTAAAPPKKEAAGEEDEEMDEPEKPVPFSIVVAEDWLLIGVGRQELLESVLAAMKNPPAVSAWEVPERQAVLKTMPDGEYYSHFEDLESAGPILLTGALGLASLIPGVEVPEEFSDPAKLMEGAEFPLHTFEKYRVTPRGFNLETRLVVSPGK